MAVLSPEGYVEIFSLYVRAKYIDTQIKCILTVTCFIMHYAIGRGPGFTSFYKKKAFTCNNFSSERIYTMKLSGVYIF